MIKSVYFYVYPSAFQNPGGGEILLIKTKKYLEKLGVEVRLFNLWSDKFKTGDLLHVFGSVKEALGLMETAKSKGVRIVISPIVWYNWQSSFQVPYKVKERVFCILRQTVKSILPFAPSARKTMMQISDIVLAGSQMEADQIRRYFLIPKQRIKVVPYGADECFDGVSEEHFDNKYHLKDFVLTVGRIEPRKNQLNLIRAMKGVDKPLVIIGRQVSHHEAYYQKCRREAGPNVHFLGAVEAESQDLKSAFAACSVFVLAAWFETPGLAALEAGTSGARIVITEQGSTKEYFKNYVDYVNPANVDDIRTKIINAFRQPKTNKLQQHLRQNYLWKNTAEQTLNAYHSLTGD